MPFIIVLIIILGAGIIVFIVFLIKHFVAPKKISGLENLVKQNKTAAAVKLAKQILAKEPRNAEAHYFLGLAYLAEQKDELALMELRTVNQIGQFGGRLPEVPFRIKIAELFTKFNQTEEALKEYLILLKRDQTNADYFFRVGHLFEQRNKTQKAAAYYRKAISLDKRHAESHFRLGLLFFRGKSPTDAKNEFEIAAKMMPENYEINYYLGKILKDNHDFNGALQEFEKSYRDPELKVKSLIERGGCYMSMNNYENAISELERAVNMAKDQASNETLYARYFLSLCYEKTRKIEKAIEQWEAIYNKKPNFKDVSERLSNYQDLRQDDRMKDFLTSSQDEFVDMCKAMTIAMKLDIQEDKGIQGGYQVIAAESQSKWRGARKLPRLIWFLRTADIIDESTVRTMNDELKEQGISRGIIFTSSTFSGKAQAFAESRPIDLYNKDKLQDLLKRIDL